MFDHVVGLTSLRILSHLQLKQYQKEFYSGLGYGLSKNSSSKGLGVSIKAIILSLCRDNNIKQ